MTMSRKKSAEQGQLWIPAHTLTKTLGHPFYRMLNKLLNDVDFDRRIETICQPYYAESIGRPSIAPGVYFRMLFVGYFEDIESQRGIAWRCADSLSLRAFLGLTISGKVPDHSSLTRIRQRLPMDVYDEVFAIVLAIANSKELLKCDAFATDSTMLEANAAMKSIVRKDTGENWSAYVRRLMADDGIDDPTDEEVRRYDAKRKRKPKDEVGRKPKDKVGGKPKDEVGGSPKMKLGGSPKMKLGESPKMKLGGSPKITLGQNPTPTPNPRRLPTKIGSRLPIQTAGWRA